MNKLTVNNLSTHPAFGELWKGGALISSQIHLPLTAASKDADMAIAKTTPSSQRRKCLSSVLKVSSNSSNLFRHNHEK